MVGPFGKGVVDTLIPLKNLSGVVFHTGEWSDRS